MSIAAQLSSSTRTADMFKIGIGPSSSHTVGPMRAAALFAERLDGLPVARVTTRLCGSLGATGRGHMTDRAVILGLQGYLPQTVESEVVADALRVTADRGSIDVAGREVRFDVDLDVVFEPRTLLPFHVNGMVFTALDDAGSEVARGTFYSTGGGFVSEERDGEVVAVDAQPRDSGPEPYPYRNAAELLEICAQEGLSISEVARANDGGGDALDDYLDLVHRTMDECIDAGCEATGVLPGGLNVPRRAAALRERLMTRDHESGSSWRSHNDPMAGIDWVNLYALAVNEQNAAGQRVVTAPTNGAAGIIPAVLRYYERFIPGASRDGARTYLVTAAAIGAVIKANASIAGAEVGCQGEVGSASSMAAAGLAEALGGTPLQVENAAEIAMEHSLGLTCDPVAGLVQIPCIERNAIGAVKAINAARMALWGDGRHYVPLDTAIETMRQTGHDMLTKYKETSEGGLAVNVIEC
ncbi:MAG: L-serine ammonia-lyase [Propionibacterium sp.]|nr:L-serine ammonia-lyase [Propionibacterium sp.]